MAKLVFDPTNSDLEEVSVPIGGFPTLFKRGLPVTVPDNMAAQMMAQNPELYHLADASAAPVLAPDAKPSKAA
jgi:hypothetical protein